MHEFYSAYTYLLRERHRKFVIPVLLEDLDNVDCNPSLLAAQEVLQIICTNLYLHRCQKFQAEY